MPNKFLSLFIVLRVPLSLPFKALGTPVLVFDFGTAMTVSACDENGSVTIPYFYIVGCCY